MDKLLSALGEYGLLIIGILVVVMFVELLCWLNEKPFRKSKRFNPSVRCDEEDSMCDWLAPRENPNVTRSMQDSPPARKISDSNE